MRAPAGFFAWPLDDTEMFLFVGQSEIRNKDEHSLMNAFVHVLDQLESPESRLLIESSTAGDFEHRKEPWTSWRRYQSHDGARFR